MEYSFKRDDMDQPVAQLNMEAEAFGHWLSIEMGERNAYQVAQVIDAAAQLLEGSRWQYQLQGREFSLELTRDQALVKANAIAQNESCYDFHDDLNDELESNDELDDEGDSLGEASAGLVASSGLEDFGKLMNAWSEYIRS